MMRRGLLAAFLLTAMAIVPGSGQYAAATPQAREAKPRTIRILGVGFAAEGGMIMVSFTCDPRETYRIYQGTVSVVEEATGAVYNEIIVLPKIGPLISRPTKRGQKGYVMIVNPGSRLKPGDMVTVAIAGVRKEHLRAEDWRPREAASAPSAPAKESGK